MIKGLLQQIRMRGDRGAVVSFHRIDDLKKDMHELKNGDHHPQWLDRMTNHIMDAANKFVPADMSFEPRSLITVVMPSPKLILQFWYHGKLIDVVVPPEYMNWDMENKRALHYISNYLAPHGFSAVTAVTLPQKMLAVHAGLGQYGRNNICYHEEFGSYMQIMSYISDLPCEDADWFPLTRMGNCDKCHACVNACPTGAIHGDRQLINSDRCITVANEFPGAFPEWLTQTMHNSIIGCIKCQDCCPANARNKDNIVVGTTFEEEETLAILNRGDDESYADVLATKLNQTGIAPELSVYFPRNLSALLARRTDAFMVGSGYRN